MFHEWMQLVPSDFPLNNIWIILPFPKPCFRHLKDLYTYVCVYLHMSIYLYKLLICCLFYALSDV
jgi:hypothetical protein